MAEETHAEIRRRRRTANEAGRGRTRGRLAREESEEEAERKPGCPGHT